jgi:hypothetical protein
MFFPFTIIGSYIAIFAEMYITYTLWEFTHGVVAVGLLMMFIFAAAQHLGDIKALHSLHKEELEEASIQG